MAYYNGPGFGPPSNERQQSYPRAALQQSYQHKRSISRSSNGLGFIDENRSKDFSEARPLRTPANITDFQSEHLDRGPSLLGRLTTSLKRGTSYIRPTSRNSHRNYASVDDWSNDYQIAVDMSSLGRSGFELQELPKADPTQSPSYRDSETSYVGAFDSSQASSFNDFRRRTLGYGMTDVGARLERDDSVQTRQSAV